MHLAAGQARVSSSIRPRWATQSSQVLPVSPCGAGSWEPPGSASSLAYRWSQGCHTSHQSGFLKHRPDCVPYLLIENPQALRKVAAPVHSVTVSPAHTSSHMASFGWWLCPANLTGLSDPSIILQETSGPSSVAPPLLAWLRAPWGSLQGPQPSRKST